eukprot:11287691-Karenia_brevis.AAC.1
MPVITQRLTAMKARYAHWLRMDVADPNLQRKLERQLVERETRDHRLRVEDEDVVELMMARYERVLHKYDEVILAQAQEHSQAALARCRTRMENDSEAAHWINLE